MLVCDTGVLVAAANVKDQQHEACARLLSRAAGPLLVPSPVIAEVCYLLESRRGSRTEASFLRSFEDGLHLAEVTPADLSRMAELVSTYDDLPLGAVDASVVAVAERVNAAEIATLDRRHFSIVRPRHVPLFQLLPS